MAHATIRAECPYCHKGNWVALMLDETAPVRVAGKGKCEHCGSRFVVGLQVRATGASKAIRADRERKEQERYRVRREEQERYRVRREENEKRQIMGYKPCQICSHLPGNCGCTIEDVRNHYGVEAPSE
jgi:hypothetical protein